MKQIYSLNLLARHLEIEIFNKIKKERLLLIIPGGSFLDNRGVADELFKSLISDNKPFDNLDIMLLDERVSDLEEDYNSYKLMKLKSFNYLIDAGASFYPITLPGNELSLEQSDRLDELLNRILSSKSVLTVFGVGDDSHIAGILPHSADHLSLFNTNQFINYSPQEIGIDNSKYKRRITPGFKLIKYLSKNSYLYSKGQSDYEALSRLIKEGQYKLNQFPLEILRETNVRIYYNGLIR